MCSIIDYICFSEPNTIKEAYYVKKGSIFIDLRAAFDTINREILQSKLTVPNIEPRPLALIKALYTNICLKVLCRVNGTRTHREEIFRKK